MSVSDRLARLREALGDIGVDRLLVTDLSSVRWLTGFSGSAGAVLVPAEGPVLLATDDRYAQRAAAEAPAARVVIDRTWGWLVEAVPAGSGVAVEADVVPWATVTTLQDLLTGTELVPTTGILRGVRARKDQSELEAITRACAITTSAFEDALGWLVPGLTEREVDVRLARAMVEQGADGSAFQAIIASGPNGAVPHHAPGDRRLQRGDLLTLDFGARVDGYHADMTRTVAIGTPPAALRGLHDLVHAAQEAGVGVVADGVATSAVDLACRTVIAEAGHGEDFRHGTGHGVGLDIHEEPFLGARTAGTLRSRMTVTVEPGVYVPGLGGVRIEDVVLVGDQGAERLTTASRELLIL